jgi:hypothetical protein
MEAFGRLKARCSLKACRKAIDVPVGRYQRSPGNSFPKVRLTY